MSELVEAPASFYINASQYNETSAPVDATIKVEDRQDILKRSDDWFVNVVRWTIDTQSTLNYLPADPTATLTMELFKYTRYLGHGAPADHEATDSAETRVFTLDRPMATLASFLVALNEQVPQIPIDMDPTQWSQLEQDEYRFIGSAVAHRCGTWRLNADGKFRFAAHEPRHQPTDQLFLKVRMSASMQKILGTEVANIYTLTQQSRLVDWRNVIRFVAEEIATYRANPDNFRFTPSAASVNNVDHNGHPRPEHLREVFLADFHVTLENTILKHLEKYSHVSNTNAHPGHFPLGGTGDYDTIGTTACVHLSSCFTEYTSMATGQNAMNPTVTGSYSAKKTNIFTSRLLHAGGDHGPETMAAYSLPADPNNAAAIPWENDMIWYPYPVPWANIGQNQGHARMRQARACRLYGGSWARSFLLKVSGRKITLNRGNYAFTDGAPVAQVDNGGQSVPPAIGDTLLIPDVQYNDGSGPIQPSRFRRFFITDVQESTLQNDHDATVQNTYDVYVDGYVPILMYPTIERDTANEKPSTHVIYTTKRKPWDPCVHYNHIPNVQGGNTTSYDPGTDLTTIHVDYPLAVDVGGKLYAGTDGGILPGQDNTAYIVHTVANDGLTFTIQGDKRHIFVNNFFFMGFLSDNVYAAIHAADLENTLLTSSAQFISHDGLCLVDHTAISERIRSIHKSIARMPSIAYWGTYQIPHRTWSKLTEAESAVPATMAGIARDGSAIFQFQAQAAVADTIGELITELSVLDGCGAWPWVDGANAVQTGVAIWDNRLNKIVLPAEPLDSKFVNFVNAHISEDMSVQMRNVRFTEPVLYPRGVSPQHVSPGAAVANTIVVNGQNVQYTPYRRLPNPAPPRFRGPWHVCGTTTNAQGNPCVIVWATDAAKINNAYSYGKYTIKVFPHSRAATAVLKNNATLHFANEANINKHS